MIDTKTMQAALAQAEAEARRSTDKDNVLAMIAPQGALTIGGRVAQPLSEARRIIVLRGLGVSLADAARNDDGDGAGAMANVSDWDALLVTAYVMFESDVSKLYRLASKPGELAAAAIAFIDAQAQGDWDLMAAHAAAALNEHAAVAAIGNTGGGPGGGEDTETSAEKNGAALPIG